jgi:hypothetical protein
MTATRDVGEKPRPKRSRPKPRDDDLMGAYEVAHELGINVANVGRLHGMPDPITELKATRIWWAADIREFARKRKTRRSRKVQQDKQLGKVG